MARLYSDENFPVEASVKLKQLGHDVRTCQESGQANQEIEDRDVLAYAISLNRAVLTYDRGDFKRLHRERSDHCGIVSCTRNDNFEELAQRIHEKLVATPNLAGELVRVYRPG